MYHSIGESINPEAGGRLYCVGLNKFKQQMELIHRIKAQITLTFDDGLENNYINALTVLKKFDLKAYFFIIAGRAETENYMNWRQIASIRNSGMIIGSHGMTHRILTQLSNKELHYELTQSKRIIEDKLRQPVEAFSIPRGFYNRRIIDKIREAGYVSVFTSRPKDCDGFKFGRIPVKAGWDLDYFAGVIAAGLPLRENLKEIFKDTAKKLLGAARYDGIRAKMLE